MRVAIDTNLLLLLVVGQVNPEFVERHKRLKAYSQADFDLLKLLIGEASGIVTTPNVLTEFSNLLGDGVTNPLHSQLYTFAGSLIPSLQEEYRSSSLVVRDREFNRLGLADCAWLAVLDNRTVLYTADRSLYASAIGRGHASVNWNHIREAHGVV